LPSGLLTIPSSEISHCLFSLFEVTSIVLAGVGSGVAVAVGVGDGVGELFGVESNVGVFSAFKIAGALGFGGGAWVSAIMILLFFFNAYFSVTKTQLIEFRFLGTDNKEGCGLMNRYCGAIEF
jgi:hypothetical protein